MLREIGIMLVIFGHLSQRTQISRILIYSFHMPLFFIISGYFTKNRTFLETIKKELKKSIFVAYIFVIVDIIITLLIGGIQDVIKIALIFNGSMINSPLWFLFTLSTCKVIYSLIKDNNKLIYFIFSLTMLICILNLNKLLPEYWLFNTIVVMPFYLTGVLFKKNNILDKKCKNKITFLSLVLLVIFTAIFNGYTDLNVHINGKNYLLFYFTGVGGTLCCKYISNIISKYNNIVIRVWEKIGNKSLIILVTHYYICRKLIPIMFEKFNLLNIQYNIIIEISLTIMICLLYYMVFILVDTYKYKKNNKVLVN